MGRRQAAQRHDVMVDLPNELAAAINKNGVTKRANVPS